jgi:hypothetical protein
MKIAFWGKGKQSLGKEVEKILTAEDAQKITYAALEAKCTRWADMIVRHAMYTIKAFAEEGKHYVKYNLYTTGEIASDIGPSTMNLEMRGKVEGLALDRLKELGYKAFVSYVGSSNVYIEISWKREEEKK